jgi:uncharacterized protein YggE
MNRVKQIAFVTAGIVSAGVATILVSSGTGPAGASRTLPRSTAGEASARTARTAAGGAGSGGAGDTNGISVQGVGTVLGTPDTMRLSLGVSVASADVSDALDRANGRISAVTKALAGKGVRAVDVQTSGLTVGQDYDGKGKPSGYRVDEQVSVVLRELSKAGSAISAAVASGGDDVRINGVSVDLQDSSALVSKARDQAYAQAKDKAEQYARLAGRSLGPVTSLSESTQSSGPQVYTAAASAGVADRKGPVDVPIQPGQASVAVTLSVVWSFA